MKQVRRRRVPVPPQKNIPDSPQEEQYPRAGTPGAAFFRWKTRRAASIP
jgi:hypothetical protein